MNERSPGGLKNWILLHASTAGNGGPWQWETGESSFHRFKILHSAPAVPLHACISCVVVQCIHASAGCFTIITNIISDQILASMHASHWSSLIRARTTLNLVSLAVCVMGMHATSYFSQLKQIEQFLSICILKQELLNARWKRLKKVLQHKKRCFGKQNDIFLV